MPSRFRAERAIRSDEPVSTSSPGDNVGLDTVTWVESLKLDQSIEQDDVGLDLCNGCEDELTVRRPRHAACDDVAAIAEIGQRLRRTAGGWECPQVAGGAVDQRYCEPLAIGR